MGDNQQVEMDDIMLAMDVVDTLRRRQALVDHELDSASREQELVEKVKSIYAAQGIEVSDETIAAGVQALRDERFAYHPPPPGLLTRLGHLYVNRGKWGKRAGIGLAALLAAWGIHYGTVTLPQKNAARAEAEQLNQTIASSALTIDVSADRLQRLRTELRQQPESKSKTLRATAEATRRDAKAELNKAEQLLASAKKLGHIDTLPDSASNADKQRVQQQLSAQQKLLQQTNTLLDRSEQKISLLATLDRLPADLDRYQQAIDDIAKETKAKKLATQLHQAGVTALQKGDIDTARIRLSDLKDLLDQLQQDYVLKIVSRPGERSGIWRYPEANSKARNYYLIVEAIDRKGRKLKLPVTSEEDGKIREVSKWAVRVGASAYNRVAADKQDDGIIQNNIVGIKRAGYLKPEYQINTTGQAITQW